MTYSNSLFIELAIVLGLSSFLGYLLRLFKLPLIVAYLLTGVILSVFRLIDINTSSALTFLPNIGIAFVLFLIGMELDLKEIKSLGKPILITSLGQIIFSLLSGLVISWALGFSLAESFFLGICLSFSSTIVVVKLLLEKKDLSSLYGKLSLGILLLEDLVAILVLMVITVGTSSFHSGLQNSYPLLALISKAIILTGLTFILSRYILAKVFNRLARSQELLFLAAISWCFIFVAFSLLLGFSIVIGAFLAGVALANTPFHFEIQGKVKPLRDFFVALFFVYLGSQVSFLVLPKVWLLFLAFTIYAVVGKPLVFLLILGALGFRKHTIFQTALHLSQISEFSLIITMIGVKTAIIPPEALTAIALVGVVSITISSIMITFSRCLYRFLHPFIAFFEHSRFFHQLEEKSARPLLSDHVILIGGHLMGGEIIRFLKKEQAPFLVVDFNPKVIQNLVEEKLNAMYGDIGDPEVVEFLNLEEAKMIVSTAPGLEDNLVLLSEVKQRKAKAVIVLRAASSLEAETLYREGADYVIMPEILSGAFISQILKNHWPNLDFLKKRSEIELHHLSHNHFALE